MPLLRPTELQDLTPFPSSPSPSFPSSAAASPFLSARKPTSFVARGLMHTARQAGGGRSGVLALLAMGALAGAAVSALFGAAGMPSFGRVSSGGASGGQGTRESETGVQVHPIIGLMKDAEESWTEVYERQSKTLDEVVAEYRRRYSRSPPAGFDAWFAWAREHSVHFVDEYDALDLSIRAFSGLSPARLRKEIEDWVHKYPIVDEGSREFQIRVEGGKCVGRGMDRWVKEIGSSRRSGWEFCEAIKDIVHLIPDTPDFIYTTSDMGRLTVSHDEQQRLHQLALSDQRAGVDWSPAPYMSPSLLAHSRETGYLATALSCPPGTPARAFHTDAVSGEIVWDNSENAYKLPEEVGGFIVNASKAQDVCYNTELRKTLGNFLQWPEASAIVWPDGTPRTNFTPIFSQSKFSSQIDWLIPQLYGYPTLRADLPEGLAPPPWEERANKMVWRGGATGVFYPGSHTIGGDWEESQRIRLHKQCNDPTGWASYVSASPPPTSLLQHGTTLRRNLLEWYDCGLTHAPDCGYDECSAINELFSGGVGRFEWKEREEHYGRFKLVADVDGFGWSGRFRDLLLTGSVVLKATAFPEFFSAALVPWYHYVPFALAGSDLPSLLAFFLGSPAPASPRGAGAHDGAARAIGARGRQFALRHWRKEDVQAWVWRALLEYRRLYAESGEGDYAE